MKKYLSASLLSLCCMGAYAEPIHPGLSDTWDFTLGVFNQGSEADLKSTSSETSSRIDLGLDDNEIIPQIGMRWRFKDKWAFSAAYADFSVPGYRQINTEFEYDDVIYPVDAKLDTKLNIGLYIFALDYAFKRTDTTELGVGFGLHALDLSASLKARLNDNSLALSSDNFLAPLPNIRLFARHAFSPKLLGHASIGWLSATIDKFEGELLVGNVGLQYRFADRWSLGVNYQITDINVTVDRTRADTEYDIRFPGFGATISYAIP